MSWTGLAWRLALAIAGLTLATLVIVLGVQDYLNWLAVAEQLTGLCWMVAAMSSLASVLYGVCRRGTTEAESGARETLDGAETAVGHAIYLYTNRTLRASRHLAPSFIAHLRSLGFEVVATNDAEGVRQGPDFKYEYPPLEDLRNEKPTNCQKLTR